MNVEEIIFDGLHALVGALVVAFATTFGQDAGVLVSALGGAAAGALVGSLAELKERNPYIARVPFQAVSLRDMAGYAAGGAILGAIL